MADQKNKKNIFQKIGKKFVEIRQELKRVIWPTKEKLVQTSVVVLAVIVAATVLLTLISQGGTFVLEKIGFYNQVIETTPTTTPTPTIAETTAADAEGTTAEDSEDTTETTPEESSED